MRRIRFLLVGSVLALLSLGFIPTVLALPTATATITFSPASCVVPGCTAFAVNMTVNVDSVTCPSPGGTFSGNLTVDGSPIYPPGPSTPCGSTYSVVFHKGFLPSLRCGTGTYEFYGTTYGPTGGPVGSFDVTTTYTITGCTTSVPQFGLPTTMVAAMSMLSLVLLRRRVFPSKK